MYSFESANPFNGIVELKDVFFIKPGIMLNALTKKPCGGLAIGFERVMVRFIYNSEEERIADIRTIEKYGKSLAPKLYKSINPANGFIDCAKAVSAQCLSLLTSGKTMIQITFNGVNNQWSYTSTEDQKKDYDEIFTRMEAVKSKKGLNIL